MANKMDTVLFIPRPPLKALPVLWKRKQNSSLPVLGYSCNRSCFGLADIILPIVDINIIRIVCLVCGMLIVDAESGTH
jgi:hypothetical protein